MDSVTELKSPPKTQNFSSVCCSQRFKWTFSLVHDAPLAMLWNATQALCARPEAPMVPFQVTKASNDYLKSTIHKPEICHSQSVHKDNEQLTLRLLTWRQTGDTLRPMDVFHARGQHSAVPLLDSANNCDRDNAERVPFCAFPLLGGRTLTYR